MSVNRRQWMQGMAAMPLFSYLDCRTGLEDNIKFDRDRLAASNAELVARITEVCGEYGRHPASPAEARELLGIGAA